MKRNVNTKQFQNGLNTYVAGLKQLTNANRKANKINKSVGNKLNSGISNKIISGVKNAAKSVYILVNDATSGVTPEGPAAAAAEVAGANAAAAARALNASTRAAALLGQAQATPNAATVSAAAAAATAAEEATAAAERSATNTNAKIKALNTAMEKYKNLNNKNINAYLKNERNPSNNMELIKNRNGAGRNYGNFFTRAAARKLTRGIISKVPPTAVNNYTNKNIPTLIALSKNAKIRANKAEGNKLNKAMMAKLSSINNIKNPNRMALANARRNFGNFRRQGN